MKVLVTGGSGYLGTHVRQYFGADDFSRRAGLDVLDLGDVTRVADYDMVIHLAAFLDKDPATAELCFRTNVEGTVGLLRNMKADAVFVFASTKDVYGAHASVYEQVPEECPTDYCGQSALEWSKLVAERYVEYYSRRRSFRSCIFRLGAVYARSSPGNQSGFVGHYLASVQQRQAVRLPLGGHPVRDLLHVDDFCRACQAFVSSSRGVGLYNLGGGRENAMSLRELVETAGRLADVAPIIETPDNLPHPVPVNYVSDLTRAQDQLNWRPLIGIEEGLRSLL